MYANKLAVAVKHRGKVLQEFGEVVYLPFGSEYGLLIKNLNSVRASVKVSIDGQDVTQGVSLVVQPNSSIDLERFIKHGNLNAGNRFKFIERTAAVKAHRGVGVDDGVIRVAWSFEVLPQQQWVMPQATFQQPPSTWWYNTSGQSGYLSSNGQLCNGVNGTSAADFTNTANSTSVQQHAFRSVKSADAAGVTAPGSVSHQQFQPIGWFQTEAVTHAIVLQLAGQSAQVGNVSNVVYSRTKVACTMCGYQSKPSAAFCSQCGSALNVIG